MSDRIARLSAIYHAALEKPADARDLFLREACGSDSGLRNEVASLLAQRDSATAFLSSPAFTMTAASSAGSMIGRHLGVYRLEALIGVGGMGEVYRARDTHLGREVAIKVLPPALSTDPGRLARFEREARTLASVRHSHIGALFGIVEADDVRGLVLELIDGQTLADRLVDGPLPIDDAIEIARQLADALEGAHELGIVHRDLKPANIKIRPDGVVKLIDFGLAKVDRDGHAGSLPSDVTTAGAILGTATYMSPEQARADDLDRRTDIWAFGCIVYEMLTGRPAFPGRTISDTIAAVLEREPDWSALPRATPRPVHDLIARCLQKAPRQRLRDIGDARLALQAIQRGTATAGPSASKGVLSRRAVGAGLGLAAMLIVALPMWTSRDSYRQISPSQLPARHLDLDLGPEVSLGTSIGADVVISGDGSRLALVSGDRLMTRRLDRPDRLESVALADTDGAYSPFFSPDGDWIAFFTVDALKKVRFDGGPVTVVSATTAGRGGSWDINGVITLAAGGFNVLSQVPVTGGSPVPLTTFERAEVTHRWPQVLPDASAVIFTAHSSPTDFNGATVELVTLPDRRRTTLVENATFGRYVERADGRAFIAYFSGGALLAAPFDRTRMIIDGEPVPLFDRVAYSGLTGYARIDFSRTGDTVFRRRLDERVHWIDASGSTTPLLERTGDFEAPALSHDGRRLAIRSGAHVVVYDSERDAELPVAANSREPVWTPDDQHLVVSNNNGMAIVPADGSAPPQQLTFTSSGHLQVPSEFTSDGRELLFSSVDSRSGRSWDLWSLPMSATLQAETPVPLLQTTEDERHPRVSPDGRWLAYMSAESQRLEVYVRRIPDLDRRWQVSTNGGRDPQWSSDGQTLFFRSADNHLVAVPYTVVGDVFTPGRLRAWTREPLADVVNNFTVGPDSRRVAALLPEGGAQQARSSRHLVMVLNPFDSIAGQ